MLYFKHQELVDRYHVSLKTVHNWIDAAKQGKLELLLHEYGNRTYVANNPSNITVLKNLAEQGKKYRNTKHQKVVTPKPEFYDLYNRRQILDIISNINIHHEIPFKYSYFDGGAENWDNYIKRLENEETTNTLTGTVELINASIDSLDLLIEQNKRVNIVDIGVGNAMPIRELLDHLLKRKLLHRYIAVDVSESMLHIAKRNIDSWFNGEVQFEGHIRDVTYERFDDLLVDDMLDSDADKTVNLVLVLGGTLTNFRSYNGVLNTIYGSMSDRDLLIYTAKPDTEASRRYFDFGPQSGSAELSPSDRFMLDLMNIDDSLYTVEMGYNEEKRMRYISVKLKAALIIDFQFEHSDRNIYLEKGSSILLWRAWHMNALEIISTFEKSGFMLLHSSMTKDREYLMTISGVDTKADVSS